MWKNILGVRSGTTRGNRGFLTKVKQTVLNSTYQYGNIIIAF